MINAANMNVANIKQMIADLHKQLRDAGGAPTHIRCTPQMAAQLGTNVDGLPVKGDATCPLHEIFLLPDVQDDAAPADQSSLIGEFHEITNELRAQVSSRWEMMHPDGSDGVEIGSMYRLSYGNFLIFKTLKFNHGATNEELLEILVDRIGILNKRLPCRENSLAITKLQEGLFWLNHRTAKRIEQGVESTEKPHKS